jgi:hypothetical protein
MPQQALSLTLLVAEHHHAIAACRHHCGGVAWRRRRARLAAEARRSGSLEKVAELRCLCRVCQGHLHQCGRSVWWSCQLCRWPLPAAQRIASAAGVQQLVRRVSAHYCAGAAWATGCGPTCMWQCEPTIATLSLASLTGVRRHTRRAAHACDLAQQPQQPHTPRTLTGSLALLLPPPR